MAFTHNARIVCVSIGLAVLNQQYPSPGLYPSHVPLAAQRYSLGVSGVAELRRPDAEVDDLGEVELSLRGFLAAGQHLPVQLVQPDTGRLTARVCH